MKTNLKNYFFYLSAFIVIIMGIKFAKNMIILILLSIFLSTIFLSILNFFRKFKIPDLLSYILIILIFLFLGSGLFIIITHSLNDFIQNLPLYQAKIAELSKFNSYGFQIELDKIIKSLDFGAIVKYFTTIFGNIGTFLSKLLLIIIGIIFILHESNSFEYKLKIIFKNNKEKLENFELFSKNMKKYFIVKTFTSFLTGFIVATMLIFFGIEYPILWGVIAFIFNFIPVIGSIVASIPAIALALISVDIQTLFWIILFYLTINISISNILEPKLFGEKLGLSPMVIFFSLIFWGWTLGITGMLLAVPITMTLKIAFDTMENTKWIGILMSDLSKKIN